MRSEIDLSAVRAVSEPIACGSLLTTDDRGALWVSNGARRTVLSARLVEPAIVGSNGAIIAWTDDSVTPGATALRVARCDAGGSWSEPRALVDDGTTPNRLAISPDGARIAYVATAGGIASVWIVEVATARATQLTNVDLVRSPGAAPAGFVPVPHRTPPRFEGDVLTWTSPDGDHEVRLP